MVETAATEPPFDDDADLAVIQDQFSSWLANLSAAVGRAVTDLGALKEGPHADSAKVVDTMIGALTQMKGVLDAGKAKVDAADPTDPEGFAIDMKDAEGAAGTARRDGRRSRRSHDRDRPRRCREGGAELQAA